MVTAISIVTGVEIVFQAVPTGQVLSYSMQFSGTVSDGVVTANFVGSFIVPVSTNINKLDRMLREAMAAACFSAITVNVSPSVTGFVIDPEDIYVPFGK